MSDTNEGASLIKRITADMLTTSTAFKRVSTYLLSSPANFMHGSIQEISHAAEVSEPTVLRFCRHYGYKGMPDFRIALAMSLVEDENRVQQSSRSFLEPNVHDKEIVNIDLKLAIAKAAVALLDTDRSIIIDSGSTAAIFAQQIRDLPGRAIMTTGLNVVEALWGAEHHKLMLPAGTLRFESKSLSGRMVESTLQNMRFDTGYFGADSIDVNGGISTFNEDEAHQGAAMMNACGRVVVLADSSKFKSPALHRICSIERVHTIITDSNLSVDVVDEITARGTQVIRVSVGDA